ncbi:tripartite tricarboxylate transporter TctB family protein [Anoxynatronum sibiricum]|uniref:Tripartite tricarboxylate transporter TctB family protein n=1 Tax=Anoxynatronum sibiricum TaxID=210623 RepID=A0ABU9VXU9_9CLOT
MKKKITDMMVLVIIGGFSMAYFNDISRLAQREKLVVQGLMAVVLVLWVVQAVRLFIEIRKSVSDNKSPQTQQNKETKQIHNQPTMKELMANKQVLLIILAAIYMIVFPFIGFFVTSFIFVLAVNLLMGTKSKLQLFAIPTGLLIFVYILFILIFKVRLPAGIFI